jgi:hypothetical protein
MIAQNHIGELNVGKLPTAMPPFSTTLSFIPSRTRNGD